MLECQNARMLECQNARMLECQNARMLECQNAIMLECQNARMLECLLEACQHARMLGIAYQGCQHAQDTTVSRYEWARGCRTIFHVICLIAHDTIDESTTLVSNARSQWHKEFECVCPNIIVCEIWFYFLSLDRQTIMLSAAWANLYMRIYVNQNMSLPRYREPQPILVPVSGHLTCSTTSLFFSGSQPNCPHTLNDSHTIRGNSRYKRCHPSFELKN